METSKRFSNKLVRVRFFFALLLSILSVVAEAENETLHFSLENNGSEHEPLLHAYEVQLIEGMTALLGLTANISSSPSPNAQRKDDVAYFSSGVIRTPDNENEYYWITPIAAFSCVNAPQQCSGSAEPQKVSLSYIAARKHPQYLEYAEALSLSASQFKVSEAFNRLSLSTMASLSPEASEVAFSYGILSFVGALPANTDNLWVIADVVPLFSEVGERGEVKGLAVDFVKSVLSDVGMSPTILFAPWQRIAKESITKSNVLVFSIAYTPEREQLFHWITPISRNWHGLFGINHKYYEHIDDVPRTLLIGTLKNDYRHEVAQSYGFNTRSYESWEALVSAVFNQDIDAIFASQGAIDFTCDPKQQVCESIQQIAPYQISSAYLALSKRDTSLIVVEKLKLASARIKHSNKFANTANQWSEMVNKEYHFAHYIENGVVHLWKKQK